MALIRSVLDYGSVAYGSAARSHIKKLEAIQAWALRVCSGAFKTSPVIALQIEIGEMLLELRRMQMIANYWAYLQGCKDSNPTQGVLQECWENGRHQRDNFGRVAIEIAKEFGVFDMRISLSVVYPW